MRVLTSILEDTNRKTETAEGILGKDGAVFFSGSIAYFYTKRQTVRENFTWNQITVQLFDVRYVAI